MIYLCQKGPLTWNGSFLDMVAIPILCGLLPRVNCPILRTLTRPQRLSLSPPSHQHEQYYTVYTDDINMVESSSVGHNFIPYCFFLQRCFLFLLLTGNCDIYLRVFPYVFVDIQYLLTLGTLSELVLTIFVVFSYLSYSF